MQFGTKSERLPDEQLQLGLEAIEQAIAKGEAEAEKRDPELRKDRAAKRRGREAALPGGLPRIEVTLEPDDKACPCCRATMIVIGEDSSERLDKIPAQYRVIVTKRPKLACRACPGTVVQEPAPPRLIEGGIPTEALVAQVVVSRFADHQPLYRQAQMMAREGVIIERSTLSFWIGGAGQRFQRRSRWKGQRRVCRGRGRPGGRAAARDAVGFEPDLCRRNCRPGARSRSRAHQERLLLGDCTR
jgi:transposase